MSSAAPTVALELARRSSGQSRRCCPEGGARPVGNFHQEEGDVVSRLPGEAEYGFQHMVGDVLDRLVNRTGDDLSEAFFAEEIPTGASSLRDAVSKKGENIADV